MENVILDTPETSSGKIYTINSIWWATFLGSPLAGAYLMIQNDKTLGRENNSTMIWGAAIGMIILGFMLGFIDFLPAFLPSLITVIGMNSLVQMHQKQAVEDFIAKNGQKKSFLDTLYIALLFLAGWLVAIIVFFLFLNMNNYTLPNV